MAEYICREAILDDIEKEIEAGNVALDEDVWINKGLRIAIRDIKDIKASDVQPIRHGRWIITDDVEHFIAVCSECGRAEDSRLIDNMPYCHCGARMDGDAE